MTVCMVILIFAAKLFYLLGLFAYRSVCFTDQVCKDNALFNIKILKIISLFDVVWNYDRLMFQCSSVYFP